MKISIKKIMIVLVFTLMIASLKGKVSAFEQQITNIQQQGSSVTLNGFQRLPLKYSGSTAIFCTNFENENMPIGHTCSIKNNWTDAQRAGVASIINSVGAVPISGNAPANYYNGELAINAFLCESGIDTSYTCWGPDKDTRLARLGIYKAWYDTAIATRDNYKEAAISFSENTLKFTRKDENYISNTITITKSFDDNFTLTSNYGNSIVQNGNNFYIKIPVSELIVSNSEEIVVTASISKNVSVAQNYDCQGAQSITPNKTELKTLSDKKTIKGSITTPKLIINKYDNKNVPLKGATIKVTGTKGYSKEFITDGNPIIIEGLDFDTYTVKEIKAPEGYSLAEPQKITLSEKKLTEVVNITDNLTKVKISKLDATGKKELKGATLEIQDEKGNIVKYCTDKEGNKNTDCKWVSEEKPYEIEGMPVGKYYLIETLAPEGYELNKEKVLFEVKDDGKVVEVKMENRLTVKVPDTLSTKSAFLITIAMFDIALGIGIITYVKKNKIEE